MKAEVYVKELAAELVQQGYKLLDDCDINRVQLWTDGMMDYDLTYDENGKVIDFYCEGPHVERSLPERPYLVGPGWWALLDEISERVRALDPEARLDYKEKYGVCQIDFVTEKSEHFNEIAQLTSAAEDKSAGICELCGGPGGRVDRQNWYMTLCDRCASLDAEGRRKVDAETVERYHRQKNAK